jgi:hypothetical protein
VQLLRTDIPMSHRASAVAAAVDISWPAVVQAVAAVAAVVVSAVGFVLVWLQLQGLKKTSQSEAHGKVYAADAEILKLFMARPHLRPYFYDNVKIDPSDVDAGRVDTIAELFCCHLEHVMLQLDNLPSAVRQSWVDYARWLHRSSPAIREYYAELRNANVYVAAMDELMYGTGEMSKTSAPK